MTMYFLTYKAEEREAPYHPPEELKEKLVSLGVEIVHEIKNFPDIVVKIPEDRVTTVSSLEGIVKLDEFAPYKSRQGDC